MWFYDKYYFLFLTGTFYGMPDKEWGIEIGFSEKNSPYCKWYKVKYPLHTKGGYHSIDIEKMTVVKYKSQFLLSGEDGANIVNTNTEISISQVLSGNVKKWFDAQSRATQTEFLNDFLKVNEYPFVSFMEW